MHSKVIPADNVPNVLSGKSPRPVGLVSREACGSHPEFAEAIDECQGQELAFRMERPASEVSSIPSCQIDANDNGGCKVEASRAGSAGVSNVSIFALWRIEEAVSPFLVIEPICPSGLQYRNQEDVNFPPEQFSDFNVSPMLQSGAESRFAESWWGSDALDGQHGSDAQIYTGVGHFSPLPAADRPISELKGAATHRSLANGTTQNALSIASISMQLCVYDELSRLDIQMSERAGEIRFQILSHDPGISRVLSDGLSELRRLVYLSVLEKPISIGRRAAMVELERVDGHEECSLLDIRAAFYRRPFVDESYL